MKTIKYRLKRKAERAPRVVGRHMDKPMIATFAGPMTTLSTSFLELYDTLGIARMERSRAIRAGHEATARLHRTNRAWAPTLAHDVDGFDTTKLSGSRVADDVMGDSRTILSVAEEQEVKGTPLEYADAMRGEIESALEEAATRWAEVETRKKEVAQLILETNAVAEKLHRELVALRRALAAVLGRSHPDYLMLRRHKGRDEGDEPEVTPEEAPANEPAEPTPEESGVNAA